MITREVSPARFVAALAAGLAAGGVTAANFADAQELAAKRHPLAAAEVVEPPIVTKRHPLAATEEFLVADAKQPRLVLEQKQAVQWDIKQRSTILSHAVETFKFAREAGHTDFNQELVDDIAAFLVPNHPANRVLVRNFLVKGGLPEYAKTASPADRLAFLDTVTCNGPAEIRVSGVTARGIYRNWVTSLFERKGINLEVAANLRRIEMGPSSERPLDPLGKRSELEANPKLN